MPWYVSQDTCIVQYYGVDLRGIVELQQERLKKYSNELSLLLYYKDRTIEELKRSVAEWKDKRDRRAQELHAVRSNLEKTWEFDRQQLNAELKEQLNVVLENASSVR
jgi:hypothetical protein